MIPSEANLAENWAPVMASGNLSAARDWLRQDLSLRAASAQHARYYVMQANPNNAEALMYEAMNSRLGPQSNLRFLQHFLKGIGILVLAAEARDHQLQINVIDTDFLSISQPYGICIFESQWENFEHSGLPCLVLMKKIKLFKPTWLENAETTIYVVSDYKLPK